MIKFRDLDKSNKRSKRRFKGSLEIEIKHYSHFLSPSLKYEITLDPKISIFLK